MAGLVSASVSGQVPGDVQAWVKAPAFAADPEQLRRASLASPAKESVVAIELLEDTKISFDADGRKTMRYRYVFRIDQDSAIEGWGSVSAQWEPWHQTKPTLRARVIRPDGKVFQLDPSTVGEFPVAEGDALIYDDRKRLSAPLPQLCVGAIAEVEVVTQETVPTFKVGSLGSLALHQPVPVVRTLISIEAPEQMPLRVKVLGLSEAKPLRTVREGRAYVDLDLGRLEPQEEKGESYADPALHSQPTLLWSTVPTWAEAATHYAAVVDRQVQGAALEAWSQSVAELKDPKAKMERLLERLHREIRYTGLEFGEGSVVPRKPEEVLKAGYGDCKDKASLLVALLRREGIPASVALLSTGPGHDVDPELPGMNHFDHAIVYVPGEKPVWIDPTAERARAGELPYADQGRWALVASPETKALVRTPEASATDNLAVETRDVYLSETLGKGRVVETAMPTGLAEMLMRYEFRSTDPKSLKESLTQYAQGAYNAKDLGSFSVGDPLDLSKPFQVKLEALTAGMSETSDVDASVVLNSWAMTQGLRRLVPTSYDRSGKEAAPARKSELLWHQPYATEWRYRIHGPFGFLPRPLPESRRFEFGPALLTQSFAKEADGTVTATFHFESGKRRWTAEEVENARQSLEAYGKTPPVTITFDQEGEAHLAAQRYKEAIQSFRALAKAQPDRGVPHSRLAQALLKAGLGDLAREEARKGCAMEPGAVYTHRMLGWIYLHDRFNRRYHEGWDYEGALAAFRKAKAVDPMDRLSRINLAILLEYNSQGERFGPGAKLDLAIQEYQALRKDLKAEDINVNLLTVYLRAGRYAEAEAFVRSLPNANELRLWLLAAVAAGKGSEAALKEAKGIQDLTQRRTALLAAADALVPLRKYAEASAMLLAGADGAAQAPQIRARAAILSRARHHEDAIKEMKGPESVIWRLVRATMNPRVTGTDLVKFFTPAIQKGLDAEVGLKELRDGIHAAMSPFTASGVSLDVAVDVLIGVTQCTVEKLDTGGFKVHMQTPAASGPKNSTFWVVEEKGTFFIAATDDAPSTFGLEVLHRLERNDVEVAKVLLDAVREESWAGNGEDPLLGQPICRFWTKGQEATVPQMRWAAAALLASDPSCKQAISLLKEGRTQATDEPLRMKFDATLSVAAMVRKDWATLEASTQALEKAFPESKVMVMTRSASFYGAKRGEEMLALAETALKRLPRDQDFLSVKASALELLGRHDEKEQLLRTMVQKGIATASDYNSLAWSQFVRGEVTDQTVDYARRSLQLRDGDVATQHTLACILAKRGETKEAMELFFKGIGDSGGPNLRDQDWYLLGLIAEQLGEAHAALSCYRQLTPPKQEDLETDGSCFTLAGKRIQDIERELKAMKS
jgi:transglutaminase-like putative cysteine protease/tetratricopeptide (TPR) repeat protein